MNISTKLKALMAAGSVGACIALFGVMVFLARVVPTGGVEPTVSQLIMIGSFVPAFLIGWASLVFTQQLFAEAKRQSS